MIKIAELRFVLGRRLAATWYQLAWMATQAPPFTSSISASLKGDDRVALRNNLLKRILRRFPYWSGGHLVLGALQIEARNQRAAYASALAARKLRGENDISARHLLARVYLSSGKGKEALELLSALFKELPARFDIAEDLAAAYLQDQQEMAALGILECVPEAARSKESETMVRYLRGKIQ